MKQSKPKKIWIDLDNSPHVPFFKPIIKELERKNIKVVLTIRNNAQTVELADYHQLCCRKIGEHYGKNKIAKVVGTLYRALQLFPYIVSQKPDLGVAHGSRGMVVLSKFIRMPTLYIGDYEHSKGSFQPNWVLIPEIIPKNAIHSFSKDKIFTYPGIKEDVYAPSFTPDPCGLKEFNIPKENLVVIIRPPATEAHYHNPESEGLFEATIHHLASKKNVSMIILPRYPKQGIEIKAKYKHLVEKGIVIIPDKVFDGLNLIWCSDFVVSGGGTMNREAAALGVPVYSIFRGKIGAVDKYLSKSGRLVLLESIADVRDKIKIEKRKIPTESCNTCNDTLNSVVNTIVKLLENT
jgi:predicted glycosyltransferase